MQTNVKDCHENQHLRLDRVIRIRKFSRLTMLSPPQRPLYDPGGQFQAVTRSDCACTALLYPSGGVEVTHLELVPFLRAVTDPKERISFSQASVVDCASLQVIKRRSPRMSPAIILENAGRHARIVNGKNGRDEWRDLDRYLVKDHDPWLMASSGVSVDVERLR